MKIERVRCDICGKEFDKNKPMAHLHLILHTMPIGMDNENGCFFDICDCCGRKYQKELEKIIDNIREKFILLNYLNRKENE